MVTSTHWTLRLPWPLIPLVAALPPAALALALYVRTLMPGLGLWDTAEFQAIGPVLGIAHPTGYPTYTLVAWLASVILQPFGDEAWRANLLSALLVSGAVGLVAATVAFATRRLAAGIVAGVGLAVAAEAWRVALSADPHALHLFFVALLLALLVAWSVKRASGPADGWLLGAAMVYGLSLGNHALTVLLAPGIAIFVFATAPDLLRRPWLVAACALAVAGPAVAVYGYLPLRAAMDPPLNYANPTTWEGFSYLVFGEQFRGTFTPLPPLPEAIGLIAGWTWRGLGPLTALALPGSLILLLRRPPLLAMAAAWFVVTWLFSLGYVNAAIERYYLGPLLVVAVLAGFGAGWLIDAVLSVPALRRLRASRTGPNLVAGLLVVALLLPAIGGIPVTYRQVDQSGNVDGRRWVDSVLPQLEQDAVIVSWWSFSTPLWYAQFVEGRRTDVFVADDRTIIDRDMGSAAAVIERYLDTRPVYLIRLDQDLPQFEQRFELERVPGVLPIWGGDVYRVLGRAGAD